MENYHSIPVVFITDKNFIMQTGVAITSLINNKKEKTKYDIYIIAAECEKEALKMLHCINLDGCSLKIRGASLQKYSDIKQLAHIPISCLLKFEICDIVEEHDKLIYLDGDIYVREDLSELFDYKLRDAYIGGVPSIEMIYSDKKMINAGVMLFNAKKMREEHMSDKLIKVRKSLGDRGSMDQQTFNIVMKESICFLPVKYNYIPDKIIGSEKRKFPLKKLNQLYHTNFLTKKEMTDNATIIHYATSAKPWKYSFIPCGEEWYKCYQTSVFASKELNRKGLIQAHIEGAKRIFKTQGIKGIWHRSIVIIMRNTRIQDKKREWE